MDNNYGNNNQGNNYNGQQQSYQQQPNEKQAYQQPYQQPYQQQPYQQPYSQQNNYDMPLKWHKFLVYFALWFSAIVYLANAIQMFSGNIYGGSFEAKLVYAYYSGLQALDVIVGILFLASAAFTVYTCLQLMGFKRGAPQKLMILYVADFAIALIYLIAFLAITKISFGDLSESFPSLIGSLIGSIIGIVIVKVYYGKRAHLFVN